MLRPVLFDTLRGYGGRDFSRDGLAGLIVGVVSLPLAIAFAIASGATPDKGLYTAIIAGFIISAFGGSRVQIGGPTGAFVVIVYGIIQQHGYDGLLLATLMAGVMLVAFGLLKMGSIIKFVPYSVITGFTCGIALLIAVGQIPDFLGLGLTNLPADAVHKLSVIGENLYKTNFYALGLAVFTVLSIWLSGRVTQRVPGSLFALVLATSAAWAFDLPVETIGSRFGALPSALPSPELPRFTFTMLRELISPAFAIAMLGAIESLLSAVVADGMIGSRHRSNMELVAQGAANIVSPFFGGLPATGAIARTAANVRNGARTPVAGLVSSFTLLLILLLLGGLVRLVPLACLAGILMSVAYHMSEWRAVVANMRVSGGALAVTSATLLLTVLVDLTAAIQMGMILSAMSFMRGMNAAASVRMVKASAEEDEGEPDFEGDEKAAAALPPGAALYEVRGPMFFGAIHKFKEALDEISSPPKVLILKITHVPFIDSTGVNALKEAMRGLSRGGTRFVVCGAQRVVLTRLIHGGVVALAGRGNFCRGLKDAVARAEKILAGSEEPAA